MAAGGVNIGDAFVRLVLGDTKQFESDVEKAGTRAADKTGQSMGKRLQNAIGVGFGALAGGLLVGATEQASKFEDQLRTIQTVAPNLNLDKAQADILALSKATGKSTDDLTAGFYDLVSAGVSADDAIGVLSDSAKFATGALGSTAEAVDLVTSVMNSYGLAAKDSARITDVFAKAVADGKVTASELGASISQIAPIAAQAGISIEEVSAGFAQLTKNGVPAAQAATQMRAAVSALLTPNAQLNKIQKETGVNFAELAKAKGLAFALDTLRKSVNGNNDAFARSLGSIDAYNFAVLTTGENAQGFAQEIIDVTNAQGLAAEQYDIKSKSAVEQGKRLVAQVQAFLITVGTPFVQTLGPAIFAINQLGQAFGLSGIAAKLVGATIGGLGGRIAVGLGGALKNSVGVAFKDVIALTQGYGIQAQTLFIKGLTKGTALKLALVEGFKDTLFKVLPQAFDASGQLSVKAFVTAFLGTGTLGTLAAKAAALIGPIAVAASIVFIGGQIAQGVQDQNAKDLADSLSAALKEGTTEAFNAAQKHLDELERGARASHNDSWLNIILGQKAAFTKSFQDRAHTMETQENIAAKNLAGVASALGQEAGGALPEGVATGIEEGTPKVTQAAVELGRQLKIQFQPVPSIFTAAGRLLMSNVAKGITAARQAPLDAFNTLLEMLKHELTPTKERARLIGELTSKELAKGLKSKDPALRAQAQATKQEIINRLEALGANANNIGKKGIEQLRKGMKSKDPDIRKAASDILHSISTHIKPSDRTARLWGENVVKELAKGLRMLTPVEAASSAVADAIERRLGIRSPAKEGPLSGIGPEGFGRNLGQSFAEGMLSTVETLRRASGSLASAAVPPAYAYARMTHRPGGTLPDGVTSIAGAAGGTTVTIGDIHLNGIGSDVSPAKAKRFGQAVLDEVVQGFRQQGARIGLHPNVVP